MIDTHKNFCHLYIIILLVKGVDGKREIIEMAADGNCLFRSLSHQLYVDYGDKHHDVRQDICDFLEAHKEEFSIFLLLDGDEADVCDFEKYVKEMRRSGVWGGDVEIACAARLYRRNITIFSATNAINIGTGDEDPEGPDILLSYHENSHYNSVHDEEVLSARTRTRSFKRTNSQSTEKTNVKSRTKENKVNPTHEKDDTIIESKQSDEPRDESKEKIKRNDLCPCGSGFRYKKCCLAIEKSRKKSKQFKERHMIDRVLDDDKVVDERLELEGGFNVLHI